MANTTPAFVVAGTHSGVGKTTVTIALMSALRKRGLAVQPFKVGARPFDTGYHEMATGRRSLNLDLWLMPPDHVRETFGIYSENADVVVVEGMRGLYDGTLLEGQAVSTYDVATVLDLPVILIIDTAGMAESAGAQLKGYLDSSKGRVAGVILNRVTSPRHLDLLKRAIDAAGGAPIVGYLPRNADLEIAAPNLEFMPATHYQIIEPLIPTLIEKVEKTVDLDRILKMASRKIEIPTITSDATRVRIAVARDAAFPFYYESNLLLLKRAGAEIVPFSPLRDVALPENVGALYLGGGIPEVCSSALERNQSMREKIREAVDAGMPIYAECGGLMYLATNIVGTGVRAWDMTGIIQGEIRLHERQPSLGWVEVVAETPSFLFKKGEKTRGYDFRTFTWSGDGGTNSAYRINRPGEAEGRLDGVVRDNLHASFTHLHFASTPELPGRFVEAAEAFLAKDGTKKKSKERKSRSIKR